VADEAPRKQHYYGGQAVVEGVMMRGRDVWALAVRKPDGSVHVESHDIDSIMKRHPIFAGPFLRGIIALGQALSIGFKALAASAREAAPEEEQLTSRQMGVSMTIAMVVFIGVFIAAPAVAFRWVGQHVGSSVLVNMMEGVARIALFLGYLLLIGRSSEIRRVFEYHGAEHKTISCFEAGLDLTPANAQRFSRLHPRCGTSFLLIVMVVAIFVFAPIGLPSWYWLLATRILGVPLIAGLSFELIKFAGRNRTRPWVRAIMWPGLKLQLLTTREPDLDQLEVAIAALQAVLALERPGELTAADLVGVEVVA
jgi:uncharacterized protein YqhQ